MAASANYPGLARIVTQLQAPVETMIVQDSRVLEVRVAEPNAELEQWRAVPSGRRRAMTRPRLR